MDGIADMGGTEGWGATHPPRIDEPVFPEPWQGRAFALALLSSRLAGRNVDAFRHALERLDRTAYLDDGYFGRWLNAAELILTESAFLAPSAIGARARNLRGEHVEEPPVLVPAKPDYAATAEGSLRTVDASPTFAVGERVRAKNMSSAGHSRLPRYVRGHTGIVEHIQPASVLPDTNAHFLGENPEYVYTVRFDSHELWGADAEPFALTIELFESYLESRMTASESAESIPPSLRTEALEQLLTERRLVDPTAIDAIITTYENNVGPLNGAKVVAKAWTDPGYRRWLLDDGTAAIKELGFIGAQTEHVVVVENTATSHHMVVCTMCSCYPWQLLGLPPSWYKDPAYRARVVKEPRKVLSEMGLELADHVEITVHDSTTEVRWLVLPERPAGTEDLSEEQLVSLITRDAMVGGAKIQAP